MNKGCMCDSCRRACKNKPGWFLPDQIKIAAQYLKMSEKDFFDKYLMVDWYESHKENDYENTFVISPAIKGEKPGHMCPSYPGGECIFFNKDKLCDIHEVKPFECSELKCSDKDVSERHEKVADSWTEKQDYVKELLGEDPESSEYVGGGLFGFLGM